MTDERTLDPTAVTLEQAAKLLGVGREMLEADVAAGAPTNRGRDHESGALRRVAEPPGAGGQRWRSLAPGRSGRPSWRGS